MLLYMFSVYKTVIHYSEHLSCRVVENTSDYVCPLSLLFMLCYLELVCRLHMLIAIICHGCNTGVN